jgi:hypothetical protein
VRANISRLKSSSGGADSTTNRSPAKDAGVRIYPRLRLKKEERHDTQTAQFDYIHGLPAAAVVAVWCW